MCLPTLPLPLRERASVSPDEPRRCNVQPKCAQVKIPARDTHHDIHDEVEEVGDRLKFWRSINAVRMISRNN